MFSQIVPSSRNFGILVTLCYISIHCLRYTVCLSQSPVRGILAHMSAEHAGSEVIVGLSSEEDMFCLAVIEYSGNLGMAYQSVWPDTRAPLAQARELMLRSGIQERISELNGSIKDAALCTIESHLSELAVIRDLSKSMGNVKVALAAEQARGTVSGHYKSKGENTPDPVNATHLEKLASRLQNMLPAPQMVEVVNG
ncbi:hypothetical protein UFOVP2_23 [uncultured Caudovirales phage]|uniref:Uncharacterized protein n=1 Tax=uncultured Caudovirales phage TaxID=2100421 RepID=A0A6J5KH41_9CAUD|nr:hypothetical protein UFOVP2_23 [uncultured Caudovirales phage]